MDNLLLLVDSYKPSCHDRLLPPNTEQVYSYLESRYSPIYRFNLFFGLQYILKKYLSGPVIHRHHINDAEAFYSQHLISGKFNREIWDYIIDKHEGKLPLSIRAVPEGTVLPIKNALVTVENTDKNCSWLPGFIETLLMQVWSPIVIASQSWMMKQYLADALEISGTPKNIDYLLHDFSVRSSSSMETAIIGGMAHLVSFKGSDNVPAIVECQRYYSADMAASSVCANEHSVVISWGKENEEKAYRNVLDKFPNGIVSIVSDSYDIEYCLAKIFGEDLRMKVLTRDGTTVFRLDSGDPATMVVRCLNILGDKFGISYNSKGYKLLHPKIKILQGDGISREGIKPIVQKMLENRWSLDNMATLGCGSALTQKVNRDDLGMAFKPSCVTINGIEHDIFKSPTNDSGKKSKAGKLSVVKINGPNNSYTFRTIKQKEKAQYTHNNLVEVFRNGEIVKEYDFHDIRRRAKESGEAVRAFEGGEFSA